jgi:RNA polymerase sigma-70 factor (ECF subfamily)
MNAEAGVRMTACQAMPDIETPTALEQLFWAHQERVLRAAYRITGNLADAEDVAQTVFIRLAATPRESIANPESYLYRAAINGALDLVRRRKNELALDDAAEAVASSPQGSPEKQLSSRELRQWLRNALAHLAPVAAEMFVLRYVEGRDNREIAQMLGTSRAVVAVRLHQVRAKLKQQFHRSFEAKNEARR